MAEHETIADIIAEIRALSNPISDGIIAINGKSIADRLEAAHRRERGDAAKLREALERVLCWLKRMNAQPLNTLAISELTPSHAVNRAAKSIIEDNDYHISQLAAAISAPPRNCDRFATIDEARKAHEEYRGDYIMRASNKFDFPMEFEAWLFALATEKEGGANG